MAEQTKHCDCHKPYMADLATPSPCPTHLGWRDTRGINVIPDRKEPFSEFWARVCGEDRSLSDIFPGYCGRCVMGLHSKCEKSECKCNHEDDGLI